MNTETGVILNIARCSSPKTKNQKTRESAGSKIACNPDSNPMHHIWFPEHHWVWPKHIHTSPFLIITHKYFLSQATSSLTESRVIELPRFSDNGFLMYLPQFVAWGIWCTKSAYCVKIGIKGSTSVNFSLYFLQLYIFILELFF